MRVYFYICQSYLSFSLSLFVYVFNNGGEIYYRIVGVNHEANENVQEVTCNRILSSTRAKCGHV